MNIHDFILEFHNLDAESLRKRKNQEMGSVWFVTPEPTDCRLHFRCTDNYNVLRFHYSSFGTDIRMTYQVETDRLRYNILSSDSSSGTYPPERTLLEIVIENFLSITSEEQFFQRSLIEDLGTMQYNDVQIIRELHEKYVRLAKDYLGI